MLAPCLRASVFDLIVTNFFLDCFPEASCSNDSFPGWQPPSAWAGAGSLATPVFPNAAGRAWASRAALAAMYAFFRLTTRLPTRRLVDPDPFLRRCGLTLAREESRSRVSLGASLDEDVTASLRSSLSPPVAVRLKAVVRHRGGVDWLLRVIVSRVRHVAHESDRRRRHRRAVRAC